jgi:hypothetical protein
MGRLGANDERQTCQNMATSSGLVIALNDK